MKIAVIGTGDMGSALVEALKGRHEVHLGSRDAGRGERAAAEAGAAGGGAYEDVVRDADVVFLTVPWSAVEETAVRLGRLSGTVVVDVTNPYTAQGLVPLEGTSTGEEVQKLLPGARVVKGWSHVFASNVTNPQAGGEAMSVFLAGDDDGAKRVVAELAAEMGFDPVDLGGLQTTRHLERLLGLVFELGEDAVLKVLRR